MIGRQFSHYQIEEEIGRGGMGVVYRATDTKLGRQVALKFLASHLAGDDQAMERFVREAKAAAALRHDSICAIYEVDQTDDGATFIVMPYYEGSTLNHHIASGPLDESTAISYAKQIARGLSAAHEKGLIHRDIKPGNLLVTKDGRIKILDFGLAKMAGAADLTHTSSTVGTMAYMSPEQVADGNVDERSDLWSVGVVLYEMLVGEKPFTGQYDAAIVYGIVNEPINLDSDLISAEVRPLLDKLLYKNREDRFATADELLEALRGVYQNDDKTGLSADVSRSKAVPRYAIWAVAVVAVLMISFLGIRMTGNNSGSASASVASELPSVGVMYIENHSSRDRFGVVLRDMLARNLGQANNIHVVSNQHLKDILAREASTDDASISPSTATRVAKVAGVETMILGSVIQLDSSFVIDAELMDVETGQIVDAVSATAGNESEIIRAVNDLTNLILTGSGKFGGTENPTLMVEDVSTSSLSAYELYVQGMDHLDQWDFSAALKSFDDAIAVDSTFVAPYLAASGVVNPFAWDPTTDAREARSYLERARKLDNATAFEREMVPIWYDFFDFHISEETLEDVRVLGEKYPTEKDAHVAAAWFDEENRYQHFGRALELDPANASLYNMLAYFHMGDHQPEEAVSWARKYRSLLPDVWNTMDTQWEVLSGLGRHEEAIEVLDESLETHPDWVRIYWSKLYSVVLLGDTTEVGGLLDKVAENYSPPGYWRNLRASHASLGFGQWDRARLESAAYLREGRRNSTDRQLIFNLRSHAAVLHLTGNHDQAEQLLEEMVDVSWSVYTDGFNPIPVLAAYENGLGYAAAGNIPEVKRVLADIRASLQDPALDARHQKYEHVVAANLALLENDIARAEQELDKISYMIPGWAHRVRLQSEIDFMKGDTELALAEYRLSSNFVGARGYDNVPAYASFFAESARSWYEVARMFDERNGPGDRQEAIKRYQEALDRWQKTGADFKYVQMTRDRLAELRGEG